MTLIDELPISELVVCPSADHGFPFDSQVIQRLRTPFPKNNIKIYAKSSLLLMLVPSSRRVFVGRTMERALVFSLVIGQRQLESK